MPREKQERHEDHLPGFDSTVDVHGSAEFCGVQAIRQSRLRIPDALYNVHVLLPGSGGVARRFYSLHADKAWTRMRGYIRHVQTNRANYSSVRMKRTTVSVAQ